MNISNDIQFDTNLIGNETVSLKYNGYLFRNGSDSVTLIYGYDDDWKNTTEKAMTKTDEGFVCKINIYNFSSLNFCFKNSSGDWDNNFGKNFNVPIQRRETSHKFIINENYLSSILNNLVENDVSKSEDIKQKESISNEEKAQIENIIENFDDIRKNNSNIINNMSAIVSSRIITEYTLPEDELVKLSNSLRKSINEYKEYAREENIKIELEKQLSDIASDPVEDVGILDFEESRNFDMDSLVDSLLSPVITEKNVNKNDVKYFDIDNLANEYYKAFQTEDVVSTPAFDMSTIQFNKITVSDDTPEVSAKVMDQIESSEEDFDKKKALLNEIDLLFDELNINETEMTEEQSNVDKLYELTTGVTRDESIKEVTELISETEETIKNIQTLFDEIHSINDDNAEVSISAEEIPSENVVKYVVTEEPVSQKELSSQEETSLFNEYENDSNKIPNYIHGVDNDLNDMYDADNNNPASNAQDEEDENKFLVVSNRSLSFSKRVSNKIKLPFIKLQKFISAVLGNLFN